MPRKSAAELSVVRIEGHLPRIEPPSHLSEQEKVLFRTIVAACHPQHFVDSDAELLTAYVQACLLTSMAFEAAAMSTTLARNGTRHPHSRNCLSDSVADNRA